MIKEVYFTGKTLEEAKQTACKELSLDEYLLSYQIVQTPKKGFLGIGSLPAKICVSVEVKDEPKKKKERKPNPPQRKPREEKPAPRAEKPAEKEEPKKEILPMTKADEKKVETIVKYVRDVIDAMDVKDYTLTYKIEDGENLLIDLEGEGLGVIIGRRGETLDAIQYLTGLVANRQEARYIRVSLNSGDYRLKREETLKNLAKKKAEAVLKYGRSYSLEPMNPYERRIIHATVSQMEGVHSKSVGTDPNRRVIIFPNTRRDDASANGERRRPSGDHRGNRDFRRNNNRDRRGPKPNPISQVPREGAPKEDAAEKPLYSKIEL